MTKNIAVVAANGKAGQLIVKEAVNRGLDVTAVVRGENRTIAQHTIVKDLFDLTAADFAGFDVVIDAFGAWTPDTLPQNATTSSGRTFPPPPTSKPMVSAPVHTCGPARNSPRTKMARAPSATPTTPSPSSTRRQPTQLTRMWTSVSPYAGSRRL